MKVTKDSVTRSGHHIGDIVAVLRKADDKPTTKPRREFGIIVAINNAGIPSVLCESGPFIGMTRSPEVIELAGRGVLTLTLPIKLRPIVRAGRNKGTRCGIWYAPETKASGTGFLLFSHADSMSPARAVLEAWEKFQVRLAVARSRFPSFKAVEFAPKIEFENRAIPSATRHCFRRVAAVNRWDLMTKDIARLTLEEILAKARLEPPEPIKRTVCGRPYPKT